MIAHTCRELAGPGAGPFALVLSCSVSSRTLNLNSRGGSSLTTVQSSIPSHPNYFIFPCPQPAPPATPIPAPSRFPQDTVVTTNEASHRRDWRLNATASVARLGVCTAGDELPRRRRAHNSNQPFACPAHFCQPRDISATGVNQPLTANMEYGSGCGGVEGRGEGRGKQPVLCACRWWLSRQCRV